VAWEYAFGLGSTDFGDGTTGQGWQNHNFVYGGKITFSESGTVDQLGQYCVDIDGTGKAGKIALYDTSGNLVVDGGSITYPASIAWADCTAFTATSVSAASYVPLGSCVDTKGAFGYDTSNAGSFATEGYSTFPADPETVTVDGDSGYGYGSRANFTASAGGSGPNLLSLLGVG